MSKVGPLKPNCTHRSQDTGFFMIFYISRAPDTMKKLKISLCIPGRRKKIKQSTEKILQRRRVTRDSRGKSTIYFQHLLNSSFLHYSTSLKTAFTRLIFLLNLIDKLYHDGLTLHDGHNLSFPSPHIQPVDFLSTLPNKSIN